MSSTRRIVSWFVTYAKFMLAVVIVFIVADIVFSLLGYGYPSHYNEENVLRAPSPYDMFRGKPNALDHNGYGFRGPEPGKANTEGKITIAFFGGSTGYYGDPPIPELIQQDLKVQGIDAVSFNFSSVSSNHTQHIHRLMQFLDHPFDFVVFYGGFNETVLYVIFDPRPGFPYNFFIRNELSPFRLFLLRYSSFFGELDKTTGWISGLRELRRKRAEDMEGWKTAVVGQYWKDIDLAERITNGVVKQNRCVKSRFISVLQPGNPRPGLPRDLWVKIPRDHKFRFNQFNLTGLHKRMRFLDAVHVDQPSREVIAGQIAERLVPFIKLDCI